jgi:glycosyltransferase involved in cell wall biosynthesis
VDSARAQDWPSLEILISDNASVDATPDYATALAADDDRVRYVRNGENVGGTENFNRVRSAARGDYFMWLGDDDTIDPTYVRRCVETLEAAPRAALVGGRVRYHSEDGDFDGTRVEVASTSPVRRVLDYYRLVTDNGTFYGVSPRRVFAATPDMGHRMGNDWFLVAAYAYLGKLRTLDDVTVHRATGGNTTSLRNVARSLGLSRFEAELPQVAIAWHTFADIGWRNPVYRDLPAPRRVVLGARCAGIVVRRHVVPNVPKYARQLVARARAAGASGRSG